MDPAGKALITTPTPTPQETNTPAPSSGPPGVSLSDGQAASAAHVNASIDATVTTHVKTEPKATSLNAALQADIDSGLHACKNLVDNTTSPPNSSASVANTSSTATTAPAVPASMPGAAALVPSKIKFGSSEQSICYGKLSLTAKWHAVSHGLSKKEAAAIHAYTRDEYYRDINDTCRALQLDDVNLSDANALKKAGITNPDLADLIASLVSGMKKLPAAQVDSEYFMAAGRNVSLPDADLAMLQEGNIVPMKGFISTTLSQREMVTDRWWDSNGLALFIYQSVGGNGRDVSMFSEYPREKEILFLPNTKFEVMFRGAPDLTKPGLADDGTTKPNSNGATVPKLLIALREVPDNQPAPVSKGDSKSSTYASYFGMR